ncbi:MAG TPA: hypothetical protein VNZ45_05810, partial [Bacteroidia bacterium]|nr:hypothetical protein [Bacteroidia bacterium]
ITAMQSKIDSLANVNAALAAKVNSVQSGNNNVNQDARLSAAEKEIAELKKLINDMMQVQANAKKQ